MGEIKSTLDLVMERTRHMSLSAEEKVRQQRVDFEKRLQGLLSKYADDVLSAGMLLDRIAELEAKLNISDRMLIMGAVFSQLDPDRNNKRWLDLLEDLMPSTHDNLEKILESHHKQKADLLQSSNQRLLYKFAREYGIEGSAVVPNAQKDILYQKHLVVLRRETQTKLESILKQTL